MGLPQLVPISKGGTNASDASTARTNLGLAIGTNVEAWDADLDALAALATNGLITRTGAGTVSARTITAGTGVSITNGDGVSGNPTVSVIGGGTSWTDVTGTSQAAAVNNGYISNNAGLVTVTLPTTAAVGDIVEINGNGAGGWSLAQNVGQTVHTSGGNTTTGVGGSLSSTNRYDCLLVRCITANTDWVAAKIVGNLTIV